MFLTEILRSFVYSSFCTSTFGEIVKGEDENVLRQKTFLNCAPLHYQYS